MPAPFVVVPFLLKAFIGAKIVGFVASWATSPTSASLRRTFLDHVEDVRQGLQRAKIAMSNEDDADLLHDVATLREAEGRGWTEPSETHALWNTLKFLSWSHSKATAGGLSKFAGSHLLAAEDALEKAGLKFLDLILPGKKW